MNEISRIDPARLAASYHRILELGLENLQRFRTPERFDYLSIEIDHLHNLPHYMHETNVYVHAYYFCTARPLYIERLESVSEIDTSSLLRAYEPYWQELRMELSAFADSTNMRQYTERL